MYTVNLSRGSFGLLIGWLSDLGLEAIWDVSKDATRYKEAVRTIINQRMKLKGESVIRIHRYEADGFAAQVSDSATPLPVSVMRENGFVELVVPALPSNPDQARPASAPSAETFNRVIPVTLGTNVKSEKLQEHVEFEMKRMEREGKVLGAEEEGEDQDKTTAEPADKDGDVEMRDATTATTDAPRKTGKTDAKAASGKDLKQEPTDEDGLAQPQYKNLVGPTTGGMFSPIDVQKELRAVVDRRKRIKLGSSAGSGLGDDYGVSGFAKPSLPSVCAYTVFDNGEG